METSQDVRHRSRDDQEPAADTITVDNAAGADAKGGGARVRRMAMAKQGLKSLAVAVAVPLALTLADIYFFGAGDTYRAATERGSWLPPPWALHATSLASALLMAVSAWFFWAQGGLRRDPNAAGVYAAQLALSLAWDPLVFRLGANWTAMAVAGAVVGLVWKCGRMFKEVNPVAGDLVKPCLAWAGFLAFVTLKLILGPGSGGSTGSL